MWGAKEMRIQLPVFELQLYLAGGKSQHAPFPGNNTPDRRAVGGAPDMPQWPPPAPTLYAQHENVGGAGNCSQ